ncbi:MAG: hypothetical protein U1E50_01495 [Caulobacteraceae bacterium]
MSVPTVTAAPKRPPQAAFSVVSVAMMIVVGVFAFSAFFVLSAYAPDLQAGEDGGAHALSRSAVGYAGLVDLLKYEGKPVTVSRGHVPAEGRAGVLVLTPSAQTSTEALKGLAFAGATLIILPKWITTPATDHVGWVRAADAIPPRAIVEGVLKGYGDGIRIHQTATYSGGLIRARDGADFARPGEIKWLQTISGPNLIPILSDTQGRNILVRMEGTEVFILSEPDLMNTHGLKSLATAEAAIRILDFVEDADGPVIFDVSLSGYRSASNLLRLLFDPPFLAVTLCLAGALLLMGVHAAARFGPQHKAGRVFAFGKEALADNSAALIRLAGAEARMAPRYASLVQALVAKNLAAPRELTGPALTEFLDRMGRQLQAADTFTELTRTAGEARNRNDLLTIAQRLHRWRLEMTRREHR